MALKANAIANYVGIFYTTLIGIVFYPVYLRYLGAEAYGLVGFFTLLQSWLSLLTMGVSPIFTRQVAFSRGREEFGDLSSRQLLRSLEVILVSLGIVTGIAIWAVSPWIAHSWLTVKLLSLNEVSYCVTLMGVMASIRWAVTLYQAGLRGLESQILLNILGMSIATARFVGAYVLVRWVSQQPRHFFEFQLGLSLLELGLVAHAFYRHLPEGVGSINLGFRSFLQTLRGIAPFGASVAYTSTLWVLMSQTDKLVLSHTLSLADYGYFAVVVLIANGILQCSGPISQAILPRMTMLLSQGREADMLRLYRKSSQYMAVIIFATAGSLAVYSQPLIFILSGHPEAAKWGGPVLTWFSLGNGLLVIMGLQYALQCVHGNMRIHVVHTTVNAAIQVPILAVVAFKYGATAVAITWFIIRIASFLVWPPIIHRKFAPGLHLRWLLNDISPPFIAVAVALFASWNVFLRFPQLLDGRANALVALTMSGCLVLLCGSIAAESVRGDLAAAAHEMGRKLELFARRR